MKIFVKRSVLVHSILMSEADALTQWEVEVGKQYEPILTNRNGLWRYRLGDILTIIGFDPKSQAPIFKWAGRRSSVYNRSCLLSTAPDNCIGIGREFSSRMHKSQMIT